MPRKRNLNPECFYDDFPTRLRTIMNERSCTQQDLADLLGKSRQAIGYYADGSSRPDLQVLVTIAKHFSVSTDWLLGLSDYQNKEVAHLTPDDMGLSETTSRFLRDLKKSEAEMILDTINLLCEDSAATVEDPHESFLQHLAAYLHFDKQPETIYSICDNGMIRTRKVLEEKPEKEQFLLDFFAPALVAVDDSELLSEALYNKTLVNMRKLRERMISQHREEEGKGNNG